MSSRKSWTHDELMVAMNLYCKLPFGQFHRGNSLIVEIAEKLGRTPSSLSMKLCNLASLDPYHQARGVKGLMGASRADREIWSEFNSDWAQFGVASEERLLDLLGQTEPIGADRATTEIKSSRRVSVKAPNGPTEKLVTTKARLGQRFFRQSVLASYEGRCCLTGNPISELLVASHILAWGKYPEHRLNPRNGLCLAQTQDAAFDKGLVTFDEDFRLVLSPFLKEFLPNEALLRNFLVYEGIKITMPDKFAPDSGFMEKHRNEVFKH